ncbi:hypothetical protein [Sulfuricella sp.]|uniref:hypothetical protein n=1 Tax=Sulfuricella sp. TaxID=2099377 RepID=UPI002C767CE4|nr:hypothetical protein [Sulfuricella sp.]HUX62711.1 hypothetical protein [Sulfuricella sp.]
MSSNLGGTSSGEWILPDMKGFSGITLHRAPAIGAALDSVKTQQKAYPTEHKGYSC